MRNISFDQSSLQVRGSNLSIEFLTSGYCVWSAPWASSGVDRQNRAPNIKMGTGKMFNDGSSWTLGGAWESSTRWVRRRACHGLSGNGDVCSCWHGEGRLRGRSGALNEMGWFWSWGVREAFWVRGDQKENAEEGKCRIFKKKSK